MLDHYVPSPELVEALSFPAAGALADAYEAVEDEAEDPWMGWGKGATMAARAVLTAAVAYRTPSGDPELVPWVEVAALIDAVESFRPQFCPCSQCDNLRAALAPFTQGQS